MKTILVDPVTIGVFTIGRKEIIIMGEQHGLQNCDMNNKNTRYLTLQDFFQWYHESIGENKTLDIFLESGYVSSKNVGLWNTLRSLYYDSRTRDYGIAYMRRSFSRCSPKFDSILTPYLKCPKNTRVHLCDPRYFYEFDTRSRKVCHLCIFRQLFSIVRGGVPGASYKLFEICEYLDKFLFDPESLQYYETLHLQLMEVLKINKQLKNIRSPSVRKCIVEWSETIRQKNLSSLRKKFLAWKKEHQNDLHPLPRGFYPCKVKCSDDFAAFRTDLHDALIVYMDVYTMSRIFRKFSDGTQPDNCVVYVGAYHAMNYYELMKKLHAKTILKPKLYANGRYPRRNIFVESCVDISSFYRTI